MRDTIEVLGIKEPMPVGNAASLFWDRTYRSKEGPPYGWNDFPEFMRFCTEGWVQHYGTPYGGGFHLLLSFNEPLRQHGFESVEIYISWAVSVMELNFTSEEGKVSLDELTLPKELILCLKDLLLEFGGELLFCHLCCLDDDDDPREVSIEFVDCQGLTMEPDELLKYIAQRISLALCPN